MTAEEFVKHKRPRLNKYGSEFKILVAELKEFAQLKCKEQREICANVACTWIGLPPNAQSEDMQRAIKSIILKISSEPEI